MLTSIDSVLHGFKSEIRDALSIQVGSPKHSQGQKKSFTLYRAITGCPQAIVHVHKKIPLQNHSFVFYFFLQWNNISLS